MNIIETAPDETDGRSSYGSSDFPANNLNDDSLRKSKTFENTNSSVNLAPKNTQANQASNKEKIAELENILERTKLEINRKLNMLKDSELKVQLEGMFIMDFS